MFRNALAAALVLLSASPALADNDWVPPVTDRLTLDECGQCHMAFQPAFLPARSWHKIMDGLADHFGDNASLPPAKADAIRKVLVAGAGRDRGGEPPLRITELKWFAKEHRLPPSVWSSKDVMSKANCPACHKGAERGWYEDD